MGDVDVLLWFGIGSYGGLAISLLAAAAVAVIALTRHTGTSRQIARSVLVCLVASSLMLPVIWWNQNRLGLFGPSLSQSEVLFWLIWATMFGWFVPLATVTGFAVLAAPVAPARALHLAVGHASLPTHPVADLRNPARRIEPVGSGRAWAHLVFDGGDLTGQTVPLTRKLTILGREIDNDIVIDDEMASRHHAEIYWDHGHPQLRDRDSFNGTLVNRQVVHGAVPLKTGDVLEFGTHKLRFEMIPDPAGAGAEPERDTFKIPSVRVRRPEGSLPATLFLVGGSAPIADRRWSLVGDVTSVGRDADQTIAIPHGSVSRHHAHIIRQASGYYVSDLRSSNGTLLNGVAIDAPTLMMAGDVLQIGAIELHCEAEARPTGTTIAFNRTDVERAEPLTTLHEETGSGVTPPGLRLSPPRLMPVERDVPADEPV